MISRRIDRRIAATVPRRSAGSRPTPRAASTTTAASPISWPSEHYNQFLKLTDAEKCDLIQYPEVALTAVPLRLMVCGHDLGHGIKEKGQR